MYFDLRASTGDDDHMAANTDQDQPAAVPAEQVRMYVEEMLDALSKLASASGQRRLATTLQTAALEAARRPEGR